MCIRKFVFASFPPLWSRRMMVLTKILAGYRFNNKTSWGWVILQVRLNHKEYSYTSVLYCLLILHFSIHIILWCLRQKKKKGLMSNTALAYSSTPFHVITDWSVHLMFIADNTWLVFNVKGKDTIPWRIRQWDIIVYTGIFCWR